MRHFVQVYLGVPGTILLLTLVAGAQKAWEQRHR